MSKAIRDAGRQPPQKPSTKEVLIEKSEHLFGWHGIDGISLREIATAADQANVNVVQYHFENKSGLIRAIFENRLLRLETLRSELFKNLSKTDPDYVRNLLKILWAPNLTIRDADGRHTYCRFLLQCILQPHLDEHPVLQTYHATKPSATYRQKLPHIIDTLALLKEHYADLPPKLFGRRISALIKMFLASVVEFDNEQLKNNASAPAQFDIEFILDIAIGALDAPIYTARINAPAPNATGRRRKVSS